MGVDNDWARKDDFSRCKVEVSDLAGCLWNNSYCYKIVMITAYIIFLSTILFESKWLPIQYKSHAFYIKRGTENHDIFVCWFDYSNFAGKKILYEYIIAFTFNSG